MTPTHPVKLHVTHRVTGQVVSTPRSARLTARALVCLVTSATIVNAGTVAVLTTFVLTVI